MKFYMPSPNSAIDSMLRRKNHDVTYDCLTDGKWNEDKFENEIDIVLFPGGEDIHPLLYGEPIDGATNLNVVRDRFEIQAYKRAQRYSKPCIGICRGAQLLCVLSGGSLWQDVNNHGKSHKLWDFVENKEVNVTSTHHQMMRPHKEHCIIAGAREATKWACANEYKIYKEIEGKEKPYDDTEVAYDKRTKSLMFQPHPEYSLKECEKYFFECVDNYVLPSLE